MTEMKKPKSEREKIKETAKKTTARVIKEIAKSEEMLAAIGDGIVVVDRTFKVLYENQVHKDMMGDHVGEYCYKAYVKKEGICGGCPVALTFKDGKVHAVQRELHTDTETRYVEITASPLKDSTGKIMAGIEVVRDITERKQIEEKLREGEERYRLLFNNVSDAIFVHEVMPDASASGRFIEVNDRACHYLGYSREELLQMSVHQIDAPETLADVPKILQKLFAERRATWEGIHVSKDGRKIPVEISNQLFELYGKPMILSTVRDITERRQAEEALKLEAQLLDAATDSIFLLDFEGKFIYINEAAYKSHGYTKDELMAMKLHDLDVPEYAKLIEPRMKELMEKGKATFESAHFRKDGSILPIEVHARIIEVGEKKFVLSVTRDITERKRANEVLQESEQKFINIIEHSSELHYVHDTNHVLSYVSLQSLPILGYTPDEMMVEWTKLATENPINEMGIEITEKALKTGNRQPPYLLELYKKDRSKVLLEIDESPVKDDKGNVVAMVGAARDVTKRVKAENALKKSEEQIRMLLDSTAEAIYGVDLNESCIFVNAACLRILGYDNESELLGKHLHELIHYKHPDGSPYPKEQCRLYKANQEGKSMHNDREVFWRADGTSFPVEYRCFPIEEKGKFIGAVVTFLDITERKIAEEEINRRVKELEDFYDMAVGRELRMKELKEEMEDSKKEIERLKQELDKYKKQ